MGKYSERTNISGIDNVFFNEIEYHQIRSCDEGMKDAHWLAEVYSFKLLNFDMKLNSEAVF